MTEASDWTGSVGDVWAAEWRRTDRSFAGLDPHLHAAIFAAASDPARILDIGCGAGGTTLAVARGWPEAQVLGIDLSPGLIAVAEARLSRDRLSFAQAPPDPRSVMTPPDPGQPAFAVGDASAAAEPGALDLLVSRHGVMFFADPVAAFAALATAAAPSASLVFSCFAERAANRWAVEPLAAVASASSSAEPGTAPGPFAFADPAHVAAILAAAGWHAAPPARIEFAYRAGSGEDPVADATDFFSRIGPAAALLRAAPKAERAARVARLTDACARRLGDGAVDFPAVAWIWSAVRPGGTS